MHWKVVARRLERKNDWVVSWYLAPAAHPKIHEQQNGIEVPPDPRLGSFAKLRSEAELWTYDGTSTERTAGVRRMREQLALPHSKDPNWTRFRQGGTFWQGQVREAEHREPRS